MAPHAAGRPDDEKLLIINADDAGMCHSINQATIAALEGGVATSASLMVPCGWFSEIAYYALAHPEREFGVHLTLTSEWKGYRWRPVAGRATVPSLCAPDGCLWPTVEALIAQARPEEAALEARAQIECCLQMGIDVTHLDSHMDALLLDERYCVAFLDLAEQYELPIRVFPRPLSCGAGPSDLCAEARRRGISFPRLILPDFAKDRPAFLHETFAALGPGVSELYIHAARDTAEFVTISGGGNREEDLRFFGPNGTMAAEIREHGIRLVGHRFLREAQRQAHATGRLDGGSLSEQQACRRPP